MKCPRVVGLLTIVAALGIPISLRAQAFGLNEIGSCAIARGFATTASPCRDASTIYWNAAAATSLPGWNVSLGAAVIALKGSFRQDTTHALFNADAPTKTIPNFFINYHSPSSKAAYGIGVYVPYGLTSQWSPDFPGRFEAQKASLATVYVQPNFAWQINDKWSIGGGPVWGHSTVELIQALDLSTQATAPGGPTFAQIGIAGGTQFGLARLKGSANGFGAQIAISGHPAQNFMVGARFLTPVTFKYDNADATFTETQTGLVLGAGLPTAGGVIPAGTPIDALVAPEFATGGPLVAQKVSTSITHPAQLQAGASYAGFANWLLEADYSWVGWKRFNVLPVQFQGPAANVASRNLIEDYNNSSAIRLGAEYTIPTDGWKLRAGLAGAASAAPPETVTPLLPEEDRAYFTVGAGIPFMHRYALDASYARVWTPGARGRIAERTSETQTAADLNTGVYTLSANIFAFTLRASF